MYNIHNHYSNIYSFIQSIVAEPSIVYLHPFGSSQPENVEIILGHHTLPEKPLSITGTHFVPGVDPNTGPVLVCYDQEPLIATYNKNLFEYITKNHVLGRMVSKHQRFEQPVILINTELDSDEKNKIIKEHDLIDCYYFHHAFAAQDWFRGYRYLTSIVPPKKRYLTKKFITFNRITSDARIHRSLFVGDLIKYQLIDQGHISYSATCPVGGYYANELRDHSNQYNIDADRVEGAITSLNSLDGELRIDFKDETEIPNSSFHISAIKENMESFVHVVTETCFWGRKKHLTEKIFKPIVMRQPFILVGCAHNLEYLKSYGFKTFDRWWDESYDQIEDDVERMDAITKLLADICKNDLAQLTQILHEMDAVLEHNYRWFYSHEFLDQCWNELTTNLKYALSK